MPDAPLTRVRGYRGRFITPLPWRTRLRLRLTRCVDDVAYWLVCHDYCTAAIWLYQATGLWGKHA